uniref:Uncharacterized protein n=1 Tax=Caenorhabditis japonica TaxID=281687 RepID=A0A8R1IEN8_CAEJA
MPAIDNCVFFFFYRRRRRRPGREEARREEEEEEEDERMGQKHKHITRYSLGAPATLPQKAKSRPNKGEKQNVNIVMIYEKEGASEKDDYCATPVQSYSHRLLRLCLIICSRLAVKALREQTLFSGIFNVRRLLAAFEPMP